MSQIFSNKNTDQKQIFVPNLKINEYDVLEERLEKIYSKKQHWTLKDFEQEVKRANLGLISHWEIKDFHQRQKKSKNPPKKIQSTINASQIRENYHVDIMKFDKYQFQNFSYILIVIDVYSRYVHCIALTGIDPIILFNSIKYSIEKLGRPFHLNLGIEPVNLWDICKNEHFEKYIKETNISIYKKAYLANGFHRTLKERIIRWQNTNKSTDWPSAIEKIVSEYNNTRHSMIKAIPQKIWLGEDTNHQTTIKVEKIFKLDEEVQLKKDEKIYKISKVKDELENKTKFSSIASQKKPSWEWRYRLQDPKTGKDVDGYFGKKEIANIEEKQEMKKPEYVEPKEPNNEREKQIAQFLTEQKITFTPNKRFDIGKAVDFCIEEKNVMIIIEVDQFQHKNGNYTPEKEQERMNLITGSVDKAVVFIRYNPDPFVDDKKVLHKENDVPTQQQRQLCLQKVLDQTIKSPPEQKMSIIYLFYDGDRNILV